MSDRQPRVSIGMPIYNGENFAEKALDSILAQTFEDFELIISDNASTDRTEEICRAYAAKDSRVRYYRSEQNQGSAWNHNRVVELARAEYFKWACHDDVCAPTLIAECVQVLDNDPSVVLCHSKTKRINPDGNIIGDSQRLKKTGAAEPQQRYHDLLINGSTCYEVYGLMRTDILRKTPLIAPYFGSDRVLLAGMTLYGRFHEIDQDLFFRRCHPHQSTKLSMKQKAVWIDPRSKRLVLYQTQALKGYLSVIRDAPLTPVQAAQCYLSVVYLLLKPEKWKKLLVPGPYNYLGIDFKRKPMKQNS
jgi:glycosyltransferase involved in cell wall biosynthesis